MTPDRKKLELFLSEFTQWAASQSDILAVALLGSYARKEATRASDVDLIIIVSEPAKYLTDTRWAGYFGTISRQQFEKYGKVTSLRVWYSGSLEVEYGIADATWSALPIDEGTQKAVSDGMQILSERGSTLSRLKSK